MVSRTISEMVKFQKEIKALEEQCNSLGKSMFGLSYEGCYFGYDEEEGKDIITIYEDCGHEYESDERTFDSEGNEL